MGLLVRARHARAWLVRAWCRLSESGQDLMLAGLAAGVSLGLPLLDLFRGHGDIGPLWVILVAGACAPLSFRRRLPLTAAAASAAVVSIGIVLGEAQAGAPVALAAIGSAAYYRDGYRVPLAVAGMAWLLLNIIVAGVPLRPSDVITIAGTAAGPVALGYALRVQRNRAEELARLHEAERRQARADERVRIVSDVHDVVGHHLSAIRLRAVGSRKALGGMPQEADRALVAVADLAGQALGEIRGLLTVLRDDELTPVEDTDLHELAGRLSCGDLRVEVAGQAPPDLPISVRRCVYRVVQEALTNVARHAQANGVTVCLDAECGTLVVTVDDDGAASGRPAPEGGGIRGMRERLRRLGGGLDVGPRQPHGWRVRASIPLSGGAR